MAELGNMWMYVVVHMDAAEAEPHRWAIALPPCNHTPETLCTLYRVYNRPDGYSLSPPSTVRLDQRLRNSEWSSCHRVCWFPADTKPDLIAMLEESLAQREERWDRYLLTLLVEAEYVMEIEKDILEGALWTKPLPLTCTQEQRLQSELSCDVLRTLTDMEVDSTLRRFA
ncbi:hypothetical protein BDW62DRAFT_203715 [Aspergillus aurantiobrunneus]